jgi:D-alanyl-D-alanine carboxypeptidase
MTSGIPDYTNYSLEEYAKNPEYYFSSDELIQTVVDKPATFSPGEGWHYSNTNYVIMNKIISYVTNSTIKEQITTRIINKLGLDHTYYVENLSLNAITDVTQKSLLMSGYYGIKESGLFPPGTDVSLYSLSYFNAAGSIISDTLDMNKYMHALFSKKNGLLEPVQLKELTDMVATEDFNGHMAGQPITSVTEVSTKEGIGLGYGLGVMEFFIKLPDNRNFTMYSHGGTVFGFNSNWIYVPEKQAFISYVVNSYSKNRDTLKSLEAKLYEKIANNCTSTYMPDK